MKNLTALLLGCLFLLTTVWNHPVLGQTIVISEIMYNDPASGIDYLEFIELYNNGPNAVDLHGYQFSAGIVHAFDTTQMLNPGAYLVLAADADSFATVFGFVPMEWNSGGFSNSGEPVALLDSSGNLVDTVNYDDTGSWPGQADGGGPSLELCDPVADNMNPANWAASTTFAGLWHGDSVWATPGLPNCPPPGPDTVAPQVDLVWAYNLTTLKVRFSEVVSTTTAEDTANYSSALPIESAMLDTMNWREVWLTLSAALNTLSGLQFTEGVSFDFPDQMLASGAYAVVADDTANFHAFFNVPAWQWAGALSNGGETLIIRNHQGDLIDSVTYNDASGWPTAPDGNGPSLVLCNPLTDNSDGANWSASTTFAGIFNGDTVWASPGAPNCANLTYCTSKGQSQSQGFFKAICVGLACHQSANDQGYGDYTHLYGSLRKGQSYPIQLQPGGGGGNPGPFHWKGWLDLNHDKDFDDPGELLFATSSPSSGVVSGNFNVPANAISGPTRLRIQMGDTINGPCEAIPSGEVQDYTIIITGRYCSYGAASSATSWIHGFCVNTTCVVTGNNGGYRNKVTSSDLRAGHNFNVTLAPGYAGPKIPVYWKIYLDLNLDGDYDDNGEMLFDSGTPDTSNITSNFSIPSEAYNSKTRIRFMMSEQPIANACDTVANGEVEDYTINLIGGTAKGLENAAHAMLSSENAGSDWTFELMPNPARAFARLHFTNNEGVENATLTIRDLQGRQLRSEQFDLLERHATVPLDTRAMAPGIYLISMQTPRSRQVRKLVISR